VDDDVEEDEAKLSDDFDVGGSRRLLVLLARV
jgi:hypothetical protein